MSEVASRHECEAPKPTFRSELAPIKELTGGAKHPLGENAKRVGSRRHTIITGASRDVLVRASDLLRAAGRTGPEHILFNSALDDDCWSAEVQAKLGELSSCSGKVHEVSIFLVGDGFAPERLRQVLTGLQFIPTSLYLLTMTELDTLATIRELRRPKFSRGQWMLKRAMDVAAGLILLAILMPLMFIIGLLIKLGSSGPVFFRQKRLGFLGQPFDIFKFRTMMVQEDGEDVVQARQHDPRVTRIGRFLRRSSIDELPQLLNVIRGDMSLVGPRPHAEVHDRQYSTLVSRYMVRRFVKPGMTGWAQVHGCRGQIANTEDIVRRVEYDSWYASNATVALDIKILLRTIEVVLNQNNAY